MYVYFLNSAFFLHIFVAIDELRDGRHEFTMPCTHLIQLYTPTSPFPYISNPIRITY